MIAVLAGIAFDTFPLVYNIPSFERTTMRHFLQLNILGQLFILVGVFSMNWDLLIELSGIGIILLSLSLLSLASPAIEVFRTKNEVDEVGVFSYTPGILLIICGIVVIASWFLRGIDGMIEFGIAFTVALFSCMQIATCLLSHFNRRLGWGVTKPKSLQLKFALFFVIALAHIVISTLRGRDLVGENFVDISLTALFLIMFFIVDPKRILQLSFGFKDGLRRISSTSCFSGDFHWTYLDRSRRNRFYPTCTLVALGQFRIPNCLGFCVIPS
jgi:hypothetical protein